MTTAEKARALRLQRLTVMLDQTLDQPAAALEVLLSELKVGEPKTSLWEKLHAAAIRDGKESELGAAYRLVASGHRLQQLSPAAQGELLMHAADFFAGILGDSVAAEEFLERTLAAVPGHPEAFIRLERKFQSARDDRRLAELYALVAVAPPRAADDLAHAAANAIARLSATSPLSEDACRRLIAFVPASGAILTVLESHCKKTGRAELACTLIEQAIETSGLPQRDLLELRQRVVDLYLGDADQPEKAISHVEALLEHDASDTRARAAAERLLGNRMVASRASAALHQARRSVREGS